MFQFRGEAQGWRDCSFGRYSSSSKRRAENFRPLGRVSRKSRGLFGPEKPFVKTATRPEDFSDSKSHSLRLRHAHSIKLVFSYVVKAITIKIDAKFCASRRLDFEDTKRTISPEIMSAPEKSRDFRETGPWTGLKSWPLRYQCIALRNSISGQLTVGLYFFSQWQPLKCR